MYVGGLRAVLTETGLCVGEGQERKKKENRKERNKERTGKKKGNKERTGKEKGNKERTGKKKGNKERKKLCCHCSEPCKAGSTLNLHVHRWAERSIDRDWGVWGPGRKEGRKKERKKEGTSAATAVSYGLACTSVD